MARRKARIPQGKKIQPAPLTITTLITTTDTRSVFYASLSQMASLVNRRFYRAGLNWAVAGIKLVLLGSATGAVAVHKIPSTWVASNSWEKGFRAWSKMQNEALDESDSVKPKFNDFKVFMDAEHHSSGVGNNLLPLSGNGTGSQLYAPGTWDMSEMVIPTWGDPGASKNREIVWTGPNYPGAGASGLDAVSLIEGYAASRGLPDIRDPNVPADAASAAGNIPENWIAAVFSEATDQDADVLSDLITDNTKAPYPFENDGTATDTQYPGGANQGIGVETHDFVAFTGTTVSETNYVKGGMFPGGLVKFDCTNFPTDTQIMVMFDLVPGHHRGYHCQPMQEM